MRVVALTVGLGIAFAAASGLRAHERITTTVTWDREISAIVRARCVTCHRDGGGAMSLATWAEARPWARAIRHEVMTRQMPIWNAARGYGDFANDPSLSPFEIALVAAWVDGGAPRSFVPKGSPAIRLPGPPESPLVPDVLPVPSYGRTRETVLACGDRQAPAGRIVGLRPDLADRGALRVIARLASGREESLGWFQKDNAGITYWLRTPLDVTAGSVMHIAATVTSPRLLEARYANTPCGVRLIYQGTTPGR